MLEIDIFRNYFPKGLVVVMGDFWGIACLKDAQMPWSPRLSIESQTRFLIHPIKGRVFSITE